jgi:hypothetical protein
MTTPPVDPGSKVTHFQAIIVHPKAACAHLERRRRCEELFLSTYKALHLGGKETLESRIIRTMSMSTPTHSAKEMERRLSQYEKANRYLKWLSQEQFASL